MKITRRQLRRIISEELSRSLSEAMTPAGERWLAKQQALKAAAPPPQQALPPGPEVSLDPLDKIAATLAARFVEEQKTWDEGPDYGYRGGPLDRLKQAVAEADHYENERFAKRQLESWGIGYQMEEAGVEKESWVTLARKILELTPQ